MPRRVQVLISVVVLFIIILAVYYLSTTGLQDSSKQTRETKKKQADVNIVFLGSTYSSDADWKKLLSRKDVDICAAVGFTRSTLKIILKRCVWEKNPRVCFVNGGHVDVTSNVPQEILLDNYRWLLKQLLHRNIKPVIQSTIRVPEMRENTISTIDEVNIKLEMMADSLGIDFLNITDILCDEKGIKQEYAPGGLQLNEEGYKVWAQEIKAYLRENPI